MRVATIHFNHDPTSATSGALNLQINAEPGSRITGPEWVDGYSPKPVAYASSAISGPITIKAVFTGGPPNKSVYMRAVVGIPKTRGFRALPQSVPYSPVGGVAPQTVFFDQDGTSQPVLFEVEDLPVVVGKCVFNWTWQAFGPREWFNVATTLHLIYVVPALPRPPWTQDPMDPNGWSLPWVTALDWACLWAVGTIFPYEAAAAIAAAINGIPLQQYSLMGTLASLSDFHLKQYLNDLDSGKLFTMNCRDVATAVITFANLLGANLWPLNLRTGLITKPVTALSDANPGTQTWGFHEVAAASWSLPAGWWPDVDLAEGPIDDEVVRIYDACVHLTGAVLPINMPFGNVLVPASGHRYELIDNSQASNNYPCTGKPSRVRPQRRVV